MSTYDSNKIPVEKLATAVQNLIDKETVHQYFKKLFYTHEQKWRNDQKKDYWKTSVVRKLLAVNSRIRFTDFLETQINEEFETRLFYPQLITYLRLTCFDQLGQPIKWSNFENWLKSKKQKTKSEREEILKTLNGETPIESSVRLFSGYQKIYGNKNSFFNFLNNVIPNNQKEKLLASIRIRTYNETRLFKGREVKESDKLNYLYKIRNDFTHNTYNQEPIFGLGEKNKEWNFREILYESKNELWISTKNDFQLTLKETVFHGLSELIKSNYGM